MRRRRRSNGTWLPVFGQTISLDQDEYEVAGIRSTIPVYATAAPALAVYPLTYDEPQGEDASLLQEGLARVLSNEYVLKRIVGKLVCTFDANTTSFYNQPATPIPNCKVTAGFFVARAESDGIYPIGFSGMSDVEKHSSYSPMATYTQREPWIWRRTWWLQDRLEGAPAALTGTSLERKPFYPRSNWEYGSVLDGPHIDAKSKRRIGQDDRLYFAISTIPAGGIAWENADDGEVIFDLDYRIFGALRRARQKSAF